ncbi:MAG: TolC family protein [Bacteriovoracaceae bacterium]|nr:TolC family protein [Bacteriovoracaceae bacterium]
MKYVIATLILGCFSSHAVFQVIWQGYQGSSVNQTRELEAQAVSNALDVSLSQNAWNLSLSAEFEDSFLDSLFSFQAQRTISDTYSLSLSRDTFKFGTFSFEHSQAHVDISDWDTSSFSSTTKDSLFEVKNSFIYSYEILSRSAPLKEELAQAQFNADKKTNDLEKEQERLSFYKAYLNAKLNVFLTKLAKEFKQRAQERKKLIFKRYKDGLSREVEYLQARSSELNQMQELEKSEAALKQSVAVIETILGRDIPNVYFEKLKWEFKSLESWSEHIPENQNLEKLALEANVELALKLLENFEDQRSAKLTFNAAYISNAYTDSRGKSFDEATNSPRNDSKQVSLVYSLPLGMDYSGAEKVKLIIDKKRTELQKQKLVDELTLREKVLKTQLQKYAKAYSFSKDQVQVSTRRVTLQNRLYFKGLGTFDEVIRSEEELLSARSSLYRALYEYEGLLGELAFINGSVDQFLNSYRD